MFSKRLIPKLKLDLVKRFYSYDSSKPTIRSSREAELEEQRRESENVTVYRPESFAPATIRVWNEKAAIKKEIRENKFPRSIHNAVDFVRFLQSWNNIPSSFSELFFILKKRWVRFQLIEQKYLPQRVAALKPDLAAAHFIFRRGGSIKFVGNPEWVGKREKQKTLPIAYVPGWQVEGLKCENTSLFCEGLQNLSNLYHLTYLSLKNLDTVNDWFLDLVSQEHGENLKHLDISGCKNVTYRALSCFYRFENLEVLEVGGVPDTTEFKLACLMLFDIMPNLDIRGIDLSVPTEIKPAHVEDNKISENGSTLL